MLNVPDYRLLERLESRAAVTYELYKAFRCSDNLPVLLKLPAVGANVHTVSHRFRHEYDICCNIGSERILKPLLIGRAEEKPFLVMEDSGGVPMNSYLDDSEPDLKELLNLALEAAVIVGEIHSHKIIHKNINSENFLYGGVPGGLKITGFDIATVFPREIVTPTGPTFIEGQLDYISPEQTGRMNRSVDYRTDFYSLGITFYRWMTGELPFIFNDELELIHCHIAREPEPLYSINPVIPKAVSGIVMKLLAKNAEERYQGTAGLISDLQFCIRQMEESGGIGPFEPGKQDVSEKLQIPQKLYGRESEINRLLEVFDYTDSGRKALYLVSGCAGVGKSSLVHEVHKPTAARRGYFIEGKFDQFLHHRPYSAWFQAFGELVNQLLTESPFHLRQWKQRIQEAVGENGRVLTDVFPHLEMVVGEQPEVPRLGPYEAQNRFNYVFLNFIKVIAGKEHPLVVFLDDLQWVDSSSLSLLEVLLTREDISGFLVIGAYRDNELNSSHPLSMAIEKLLKENVEIQQICLSNLSEGDIHRMISESLVSPPSESRELAGLVYSKTAGNAFFAHQMLHALEDEHLLVFERESHRWRWDMEALESLEIAGNVVELMTDRIRQLPAGVQEILKLAACVGARFSIHTLRLIGGTAGKIRVHILSALQEGLLLPLPGEGEFIFSHDRIRQAVYGLISPSECKALHLKIGRLLLREYSDADLEENLFNIVDHFNLGLENLVTIREKHLAAELNLRAGVKAKNTTAYVPAVEYLETGIRLLADGSWRTDYELTLNLYLEIIEAEYLALNFGQSERYSEIVLENADQLLDTIRVYLTRMHAHSARNQLKATMDTMIEVLLMLEIQVLASPPEDVPIETLARLPEMTDPVMLAAMRIIMVPWGAATIVTPELVPRMAFTMVDLCIRFGNSPLSPFAYAFYGFNLCGRPGEIEKGYGYGHLALEMLSRMEARETKCKVNYIFNALIRHWKEPARNTVTPLQETIQLGLETGDLEYTCFAAMQFACNSLLVGESLSTVNRKINDSIRLIRSQKQEFQLHYTRIWGQLALTLNGKSSDTTGLMGELFNEEKMLPLLQENNNDTSLYSVYLAKCMLSYFFKDYDGAMVFGALARQYEEAISVLFPLSQAPFYHSLALLANVPTASPQWREKSMETVVENQKRLELWAQSAPANYLHKYLLVEAEKERVEGKPWEAFQLYLDAVKQAGHSGFIHEEALACERLAEFCIENHMKDIAGRYIKQAHDCYSEWQAWAKTEELEKLYPRRLGGTGADRHMGRPVFSALDLNTVLKASRAIAGEILLHRLLSRMMDIVIESAGAQKGFLVLEHEGKWVIEAEGNIEKDVVTVMQSLPVEECEVLPVGIINYTARTGHTVLLDHASNEGKFTFEPYIQQNRIKSALCIPLMNQSRLSGIIFLENNLTPGAFTPKRLELLNVLSSQAAVSLDNARLYQKAQREIAERKKAEELLHSAEKELQKLNKELEARVMERTAQLKDVNKELESFAYSVSHDLRAPLRHITGFINLLKKTPSLEKDAAGLRYVDIIEDSAVNMGLLIDHLLMFSRLGRQEIHKEEVRSNTLIDEIIKVHQVELAERRITWNIDVLPDISGDRSMIRVVWDNLISNALKYSANESESVIEIGSRVDLDNRNVFFVRDNGVGFDMKYAHKLFGVFQRLHSETEFKGTGIGLATVQRIINRHGGRIWAESEPGQGATFYFTL
jgi:predicted ATPase/signal transduction histidine kinase